MRILALLIVGILLLCAPYGMAQPSSGPLNEFWQQLGAGGPITSLTCSQITNSAPSCSVDATNASNITSGTLPDARLSGNIGRTANPLSQFSATTSSQLRGVLSDELAADSSSVALFVRGLVAPGGVGTGAAIASEVTAIGSAVVDLWLGPGTWTVSSTLTIPANIALRPMPGAILNHTGGTLTIHSLRADPSQQVFSGTLTGIVLGAGTPTIYPAWFGAKCDDSGGSETVDTPALQAIFTMPATANLHAKLPTRAVCRISSTLLRIGTFVYPMTFEGTGHPGLGTGTVLKWVGAAGGTVLEIRGGFDDVLQNIVVDGNSLALEGILVRSNQPASGAGVSRTYLKSIKVVGVTGTNSRGIRTGDNNLQADSVYFDDVYVYGGVGGAGSTDFCFVYGTANAKAFTVNSPGAAFCKYGFVHGWTEGGGFAQGGGHLVLVGANFGGNTIADVQQNGGQLVLVGGNSEGSAALLKGGSIGDSATITGFFWDGVTDSSDKVIDYIGALTFENNTCHNGRTSTSQCKIESIGQFSPGVSLGSQSAVISRGNRYFNAVGYAPLYAAGIPVQELSVGNTEHFASSLHDFGIDAGSGVIKALQPLQGTVPTVTALQLAPASLVHTAATDALKLKDGQLRNATTVLTIPPTTWTAAALTQSIDWFTPANTEISLVQTETNAACAGVAGTIQLNVGSLLGGAGTYIQAHDVKTAAAYKGYANADFGTRLASATRPVPGGWISHDADWLRITLTSGSGNLGNGTVSNITGCTITVRVRQNVYP